ncbi:MAG: sigma-70 family RNA polymerase sigma factor [Planctomycetota bacterium]
MDDSTTLRELAWLRRLAGSLVRDAADAEDAVQETLLAAWASGKSSHRGWLRKALRNSIRQTQRAARRRREREARGHEHRLERPPEDVLTELELHRRLARMVAELDEPYRETLLLRFLREWSPGQIAEHQSVPVKTVHTRIERGLERLRGHLDRTTDRTTWMAALGGIAERSTPLASPLISLGPALLPMQIKLVAVAAAAVVAVAALKLTPSLVEGERFERPLVVASDEEEVSVPAPARAPGPGREAQEVSVEPIEKADVSEDSASVANDPLEQLEGTVSQLNGTPVPGVEVVLEERTASGDFVHGPASATARSGSDGRFTILWNPARAARLAVLDEHFTSIYRPFLRADRRDRLPSLVVVAPRHRYQGRVVDEQGSPVAGAAVRATMPSAFLHAVSIEGRAVPIRLPLGRTTTDEFGAFDLAAVGYLAGSILIAERDGFAPAQVDLPDATSLDLELRLGARAASTSESERSLSGRVLNADGVPVRSARVALGGASVLSDSGGRFELAVEAWRKSGVLRVIHRASGAELLELDEAALEEALRGAREITVLLPGAELSLTGRVVDALGEPVPGASVFTPDTTYFGEAPLQSAGGTIWSSSTLEQLLGKDSGPSDRTIRTVSDVDGRFQIDGVLDRTYRLFAMTSEGLRAAGPVEVRPGREGALIRLEPASTARVAGRVVNEAGEPMAGVRLRLGRQLSWSRSVRAVDSWSGVPVMPPLAEQTFSNLELTTDSAGRFSIDGLRIEGSWIGVDEPGFFGQRFYLEEAEDLLSIEIVHVESALVSVSCREDATGLRLTTANGGFYGVFLPVEDSTLSVPRVDVLDGRSLPFITRAGEAQVILERDGEVLGEHTIRLGKGYQAVEIR